MLFVYEYCLMCHNKCLIFISKQEKRTCQHVRHISVSNKIPKHKGPFWLVMFPLSINSNKFSTEVLHTRFDLPYFVKEMFNWKKIWQAKSAVHVQSHVKEWRQSLVWLLSKLMLCHERFLHHSLSEIWSQLNNSSFTGNWMYLHWFLYGDKCKYI